MGPMTSSTRHQVAAIAARIGGLKDLPDEKNRLDDLGFDSLDRIELGMTLQDEFNVVIEERDEKSLRTIGDAADLVERLLKKARASA